MRKRIIKSGRRSKSLKERTKEKNIEADSTCTFKVKDVGNTKELNFFASQLFNNN